eukprot:662685-Alexandrium_andersonii.AAC.1
MVPDATSCTAAGGVPGARPVAACARAAVPHGRVEWGARCHPLKHCPERVCGGRPVAGHVRAGALRGHLRLEADADYCNDTVNACERGGQQQAALELRRSMAELRAVPHAITCSAAVGAYEEGGQWT